MSYKGAGSALALAIGKGSNRISRVRVTLAALFILCVGLVAAPAFAEAAINANPAETYQTRGAEPVDIQILASDTEPGTLLYEFVDSDHAGTMGDFTADATGATAAFTPGDGYGGLENVRIKVTNDTSLEEVVVTAQVNVVPVARLLTGPGVDDQALTNDNTPTFTFDATTGPGEGVVAGSTFSCRIDGVPQGACNSGSFTSATLADGPHNFQVRATSPTGTNDLFIIQDFDVDTVVPEDPTLEGPSGITNETELSWAFEVPEGVAQCRLITPGDADPAWDVCAGPTADYTGLADGDYTFEVRTRDDARNVSNVLSKQIEVDTVVDVTIDVAPVDGNLDARPSIDFSSTEDPDVTYECRTYETDAEELPEYAACESPIQLPFLDRNVQYSFDVQVTDEATNTNVASTSWLQDNTAPDVISPEDTLEAGETLGIDLGGSDADSDPLTYTVITDPVEGGVLDEIDHENGTVDFVINEDAAGTYEIDYEASDLREAGVTAGTAVIHVQPGTNFVSTPGSDSQDETNDVTPTWTFDSPSGLTTFECRLDSTDPDNDPWENCDGGEYTPAADLAEGNHTLEVRTVAEGTYADPTPASSTIEVDITAPDVAIDDTPVALSMVAAPTFDFSSTDNSATFECKVEPAVIDPEAPAVEFEACVSGDPIAELEDGDHTFTVRPVDPSGNIGLEASYTWEADLTSPEIELTEGLEEGDWTNLRKPSWDFTEADLNLVPESTTCTVDSQPDTVDCVGPWQPLNNLNDGNHTLHITSTDAAGNVGTLDVNFRVTTITPTAVVDSGPASPSGPSASFSFVSTTDLGATGKFECRISVNAGTYSTWDTCAHDLELTGLSSASRTLQVRAVDSAGNYSTGAAVGSWTWSTIGDAPDTAITSNVTNGGQAAFAFNSPGNSLATFECQLDGGAWGACISPKTYSGLGTGDHTFAVRATNQVGTTDGSPATHDWSVAPTVAPDTVIDSRPAVSTTATAASFVFSASDASSTFECRVDGGSWSACTSPMSLTDLAVGSHSFEVRATANGKTDTTPASYSWDVIPPATDPGDPQVCNPVKAKASTSKAVVVARGLRVKVRLSHRSAIADQNVNVRILVNGKAPKGKRAKRLKRALRSVDLISQGAVVATLRANKWTAKFTAGEDTPKSLRVLIKRKKGKALRATAPFNLRACAQS